MCMQGRVPPLRKAWHSSALQFAMCKGLLGCVYALI
jgi:hypothetical protein